MDLGVIALHLQSCVQHDTLLKSLYDFSEQRPYDQVVVFSSCSDVIQNYMVPILHISQAKFFKGNLVVLDIDGLFLASQFVNINKLFYYNSGPAPWSIESKPYQYWRKLFEYPNLEIITDSQELQDLYSITWKSPIAVSENFKYETLQHIL